MQFTKKFKQILWLFFLVLFLSSCEEKCVEAGEFFARVYNVPSNPTAAKVEVFGDYNNDPNSGQFSGWYDSGLVTDGNGIRIAISGAWIPNGSGKIDNMDAINATKTCELCILNKNDIQANCFCAPYLDTSGSWNFLNPITVSQTSSCTSSDYSNKDICSCNPIPSATIQNLDSYKNYAKDPYILFSKGTVSYITQGAGESFNFVPKEAPLQETCKLNMGAGIYLGIWGPDGNRSPDKVFHLLTFKRVCPIAGLSFSNPRCIDRNNKDKSIFIYESPNLALYDGHRANEIVKFNYLDSYYLDNSGGYRLEFLSGVRQKTGAGLISEIVSEMEDFLYGYDRYNDRGLREIKKGIIESMYKSVLSDRTVRSVINIGLVMYVTFYGLSFLMGLTDFGRKEIMMRLLKFGLVILFTNYNAWGTYNMLVVGFFKNGMDSIVGLVTNIFETNMNETLAYLQAVETTESNIGGKFIYIDNMIKDLTSKSNIDRVFSLLGKGVMSIIYIPIILALIGYFIYAVFDIAIKYIINLIKICFGLAIGPVFIFFVLFEKTKDMFKNWLSFMGSRGLEIIILLVMVHPFIVMIDSNFKEMLDYGFCFKNIGTSYHKFVIFEAKNIDNRTLFDWFEYFLLIGALIFITKSMANKAAYISGQLISIGGVGNADAVSESGHGQSGFNMGSAVLKSAFGLAKSALTSKYVGGAAMMALRASARLTTAGMRTKIFGRSINDRVNDAFKMVGIRNRGVRSYMRDREVDKALDIASAKAKAEGLTGADRDSFIRNEAMSELNKFIYNNPNKATALGLDQHNIFKRMDQKLIKEPMKNAMKEKAEELKAQGIVGKEARQLMREAGEKWVNENSSAGNAKEKVAEFFKKSSMKSFIRSKAEMSASEAAEHAKNLIKDGKEDEAKKFVDKFRENAMKNELRQQEEYKKTLETGGKFGKMIPIKKLRDGVARAENAGAQARRWVKGMNVPLINPNGAKADPQKNLRKFDRKFARVMKSELEARGDDAAKDKLKQDFNLPKGFEKDEAFKRRELDRKLGINFDEKDSNAKFLGKALAKVISYPVLKPAELANKFYHRRLKGRDLGQKKSEEDGPKKLREDEVTKMYRDDNKIKALNSLAKDEFKKLENKLDDVVKNSKGKAESEKKIEVNGKYLTKDGEWVDVGQYQKALMEGGKVPEIQTFKSKAIAADDDKRFTERVNNYKNSHAYQKNAENMATIFDELDKRGKNNYDRHVQDEISKNDITRAEVDQREFERLKNIQARAGDDNETIFDKLTKLEKLSANVTEGQLKNEFQKQLNEKINKQIGAFSGGPNDQSARDKKAAELNELKDSLTANRDLYEKHKDVIDEIYKKVTQGLNHGSPDVVGVQAPNIPNQAAQPAASNNEKNTNKDLVEKLFESSLEIAKFKYGNTNKILPSPNATDSVGSSNPSN